MKRILHSITIGLAIGFTSNTIFMCLFKGEQTGAKLLSIWLMSALIGLVSLVFYVEKWSLLTKTIIQFSASYILYFATSIYNKWFNANIASIILNFFIFMAVFFVIWFLIYLYEKNEFKKLNKQIQQDKRL